MQDSRRRALTPSGSSARGTSGGSAWGDRRISEPQYETDDVYAVTAFAPTLDEAAMKATRYMIEYPVAEHGLERHEANMLCSVAADLKIAEVVDENVLVSMHISKSVLGMSER